MENNGIILSAEGKAKKAKWLNINGFNEAGVTFLPKGDTYAIKEELKAAGFKYNPTLGWHGPDAAGYDCLEFNADQLLTFASWGEGYYNKEARDMVKAAMEATLPPSASKWIGEEKEKFSLPVVYMGKSTFEGAYGVSNAYKFVFEGEDNITWFSTKYLELEPGQEITLSGTIKKLDTYRNAKVTIVTRCKVEEV